LNASADTPLTLAALIATAGMTGKSTTYPSSRGQRALATQSFPWLPGRVVPSNITPDPETGAGSWTDDQLARAIRERKAIGYQ